MSEGVEMGTLVLLIFTVFSKNIKQTKTISFSPHKETNKNN
jgi:hypothetical protein